MFLFFVVLVLGVAGILLWVVVRSLSAGKDIPDAAETPSNVLIVRRALTPAHYFFLQTFARTNGLQLLVDRRSWDRRREQRRLDADRRNSVDRRRAEPSTWREGDFVVAGGLQRRNRGAVPPLRMRSRAG